MKTILTAFFILTAGLTFAQSKKEQIEYLKFKTDSLINVLETERGKNQKQVQELNSLLNSADNQRKSLANTLDSSGKVLIAERVNFLSTQKELNLRIEKLNNEIDSLRKACAIIVAENGKKKVLIDNLQQSIKGKSDSILLLTTELSNLKAPKIFFPENNYDVLKTMFTNREKDVSKLKAMIFGIYREDIKGSLMLTERCSDFVKDVADIRSGYPVEVTIKTENGQDSIISDYPDEQKFKKKWGQYYDLKYANFTHLYETGNCGWASKKVSSVEYLGELNNGDWFKFTIKGGCGVNDFSETLNRVIKIIKKDNNYFIDYVIDPTYQSE